MYFEYKPNDKEKEWGSPTLRKIKATKTSVELDAVVFEMPVEDIVRYRPIIVAKRRFFESQEAFKANLLLCKTAEDVDALCEKTLTPTEKEIFASLVEKIKEAVK